MQRVLANSPTETRFAVVLSLQEPKGRKSAAEQTWGGGEHLLLSLATRTIDPSILPEGFLREMNTHVESQLM